MFFFSNFADKYNTSTILQVIYYSFSCFLFEEIPVSRSRDTVLQTVHYYIGLVHAPPQDKKYNKIFALTYHIHGWKSNDCIFQSVYS